MQVSGQRSCSESRKPPPEPNVGSQDISDGEPRALRAWREGAPLCPHASLLAGCTAFPFLLFTDPPPGESLPGHNATHLSGDSYSPFIEAPYGVLVAMAHLPQDIGFWNLEKKQLFLNLIQHN